MQVVVATDIDLPGLIGYPYQGYYSDYNLVEIARCAESTPNDGH